MQTLQGGVTLPAAAPAPSSPPASGAVPVVPPPPPSILGGSHSQTPPPVSNYGFPNSTTGQPQGLGQVTPPPPIVAHPMAPTSIRTDVAGGLRPAAAHIIRSRAYSFVLDAQGKPIEIGSGRSAKAYLGEERWIESKTDFRRDVVIKILQKGVSEEDAMRFQMEKELLERVQGHPNIVHLFASGESDDPEFIPVSVRDKVECEFLILERLEMSLEERLKGSRQKGKRDDLLEVDMRERIFRVLDYMIPVTSAVEYAHLERNVCHRDLKPANILIRLPNPSLRGSTLDVRLADFNVAKLHDEEINFQMTRTNMKSVPGTLFFQSPEQETNVLELLVNVTQGSAEVEFFEDFYIQIEKNDGFALFNRGETYPILYSDRARKKIMLGRPYRDVSESNVRAKVQKSVGRPADIYSIGALFYYLISGAYANPKTLYDNFHKFIEYERADETNSIQSYLEHEFSVINSLRAPKSDQGVEVAPADRFFSYKHYLDGNGELIDPNVMMIIARCMIRNKPDSYCQSHDIETRGISNVVQDMIDLYTVFGVHPSAQPATLGRLGSSSTPRGALGRSLKTFGNRLKWLWLSVFGRWFRRRR
jgi:serine/threonine protein kinase